MIEKIKKFTKENYEHLVAIRRDLHSHPEYGFKEFRTQDVIIKELEEIGGYKITKAAKTGVVAEIVGKKGSSNKCIGLRADIDALSIVDMKDVEYKSQNYGMCHACGHDVHTTVLLGVARNLAKFQDEYSGTIKLFFQPAEETEGGAEPMIKEGFMENPHVDVMLGLHVSENYNVGQVRFCYETMQAASDEVKIVVKGFSSHAAHPENGVDAILVASHIVCALQSIPSRNVAPTDSVALSLGKMNGGTIANALAESVVLEGTIRTLKPSTRDRVLKTVKNICESIASSFGGSAEVIYTPCYPPVINNEEMVNFVKDAASDLFDKKDIIVNNTPSLGVEDFAYFANAVPSCFYNLGIRNEEKGIVYPGHNNKFDVDEESIYHGVALQTLATIKWLNK